MDNTVLRFNKDLYPKEAVMKAAYHFIDRCYLHVDVIDSAFVIQITAKDDQVISNISNEFENELLAQAVRYQVFSQTHVLREVLMARAMSSTITGDNTELSKGENLDNLDQLENILKDWFEKNEN